jgi:hypothetical protein
VGPPALIAETPGNSEPLLTVSFAGSRKRVGNFVQEHLMDLFFACRHGEVPRESNSVVAVNTLSETSFRVVPSKVPILERVLDKELSRLDFYPIQLSHTGRVVRSRLTRMDLSTRWGKPKSQARVDKSLYNRIH